MNTLRLFRSLVSGRASNGSVYALVAAWIALPVAVRADKSPYDWAFVQLDYARQEKVQQLKQFCDRTHTMAQKAAKDELVLAFFDINLKYSEASSEGPVPEPLQARVAELRKEYSTYYIENYLAFYDILFVDMQGKVFYTIRKESDFAQNLLHGDTATTALIRCLSTKPVQEAFVGFHNYGPSSEAAAFFVEPMMREGVQKGWIVLQCAINKLNTLFAWTGNLGQTGETILVNQDGYMLTESSFEGSSTILSKRLDDRNIQTKFAERQGHRTVTDYRGCTALTSFEVVDFLGTSWLVVAKMDTHEIITRHYSQHRRYFGDKLLGCLKQAPLPPLRDARPIEAEVTLRVDMDEFLKADKGQRLHTFGVSTCTGLLVTYPGKFAYLAHISPKDAVYGSDDTDLVGQLTKRVKTFDVYPCDMRHIRFIVVAPHLDSLLAIVDGLIEDGFLLSQIHIMYNPQAASAAIGYDYVHNDLNIVWRIEERPDNSRAHSMKDTLSIESIVQQVMRDEESAAVQSAAAATREAPQGKAATTAAP